MIVYFAITSWVFLSAIGKNNTILNNSYISRITILMFIALIVALIPLRNFVYGDMLVYVNSFQNMHTLTLKQALGNSSWEPLFVLFQWVVSRFTQNPNIFIISSFLFYIIILLRSFKKFSSHWQRIFLLFGYLNFAFFYDYIFNGMRQGFAMVLILLAISYWLDTAKNNNLIIFCVGIAAGLFHYSAFPVVLCLFLLKFFKISLKFLLFSWFVAALLFVTGLNTQLKNLGIVSNFGLVETYADIATLQHFGGETNKINFLVFSAFFLFLSLFLARKIHMTDEKAEVYNKIIKLYTLFNIYFLMFGFIAFSNRVAAFSWFLIPVLLWFPILNRKVHSPKLIFLSTTITLVIGLTTSAFYIYK